MRLPGFGDEEGERRLWFSSNLVISGFSGVMRLVYSRMSNASGFVLLKENRAVNRPPLPLFPSLPVASYSYNVSYPTSYRLQASTLTSHLESIPPLLCVAGSLSWSAPGGLNRARELISDIMVHETHEKPLGSKTATWLDFKPIVIISGINFKIRGPRKSRKTSAFAKATARQA